jgi:flavin reductase (DIM6/NTAB) family NADH-FMN oxidoreductase RutF
MFILSEKDNWHMAIEKDFFRQVMGQFATGVTVVTTRSSKGLAGLTVNAFASVSLEPPLVLICVDHRSHVLPALRTSGTFVVNILTSEQECLSRCFATSSQERYKHFCHASYHSAATGSPVLDEALAFIDTRIVAEYPGGDHTIFLGQVVAIGTNSQSAFATEADEQHCSFLDYEGNSTNGAKPYPSPDKKWPLVYYHAQYRHLAPDYQRSSLAGNRESAVQLVTGVQSRESKM